MLTKLHETFLGSVQLTKFNFSSNLAMWVTLVVLTVAPTSDVTSPKYHSFGSTRCPFAPSSPGPLPCSCPWPPPQNANGNIMTIIPMLQNRAIILILFIIQSILWLLVSPFALKTKCFLEQFFYIQLLKIFKKMATLITISKLITQIAEASPAGPL